MKNKRSGGRRIVGVIGYALIVCICVLLVFVLISNARGNTTFFFGYTNMWVRTESMEPVIPQQSYILVRRATAAEVQVGDVIVFHSKDPALAGALNTHRVIEIIGENEEFVTKGDNNIIEDEYTASADSVVAIYVRNLPFLSAFGRFFATPMGLIVTIGSVILILLIMYIPDLMKSIRGYDRQLEDSKQALLDELVREQVEKLKAENAAASQEEAQGSQSSPAE